jgi:ribosomal-protein-alanine N-acetyltransferase
MFVLFLITVGLVAAGGESRSAVTDGSVSVVGGSGMMLGMPALVRPAIVSGSLSQSVQPSIPAGRAAVLRPWSAGDAADVVEAFHDPAIQRWHVRRADSISEAAEWIDRWRSAWVTESECHWAVADAHTDKLLGRISLKGLDLQDGTAGIAYWIIGNERGRGVCTLSVMALCQWAFHDAGFHRIELEHSTSNPASCRVAAKAGFHAEGTRRSAALHADGWHDMHVHARLSSESTTEPTRTSGLPGALR